MPLPNSRFRTAVHALAVIACVPERQATSENIAASVATESSVVRKLLSSLRQAGLVHTVEGRAGGYALARPSTRISLRDVFEAVGTDNLFPLPERAPNESCPVGSTIHAALDEPLAAAQRALEARLGKTTLADVIRTLGAH